MEASLSHEFPDFLVAYPPPDQLRNGGGYRHWYRQWSLRS